MTEESDQKKIGKLVAAFGHLTAKIVELVSYARESQASIRRTGRMMLVQTVLAVAVLAMLVAMGLVVVAAMEDNARIQSRMNDVMERLAEQQEKTVATYDYLIRKFPEDLAEITIVQAQPSASDVVLRSVKPMADPGGHRAAKAINRRERMLNDALKFVKREKQRVDDHEQEVEQAVKASE